MYIDTIDKDRILESLTSISNLDIEDLVREDKVDLLIDEIKNVDEVLIHHLCRRINGTEFKSAMDLHTLLTTKNEFSDFLLEYGLRFVKRDFRNVDMYYVNKKELFDRDSDHRWSYSRIKYRLNYNDAAEYVDSCLNGYCVGDITKECRYMKLRSQPEFISDIANFIGNENICNHYRVISTPYIITYKMKISDCDWKNKESDFKKRLLNNVFEYLRTGKVKEDYIITKDTVFIPEENTIYKQEWN